MAHFAQLDENNVVIQVVVINNNEIQSAKDFQIQDGFVNVSITESESKGVEFCKTLFGVDTNWKQTSYTGNFRGKYASVGDTFDGTNFVSPVLEPLVNPIVDQVFLDQIQPLETSQLQAIETAQLDALSTDQIQALSTDQISALGA